MHNCFAVANCIIETFKEEKKQNITILALLKYVFFCYGWYSAIHKKELFQGKFTAFPFGPVMEEIYQGFDSSHKKGFTVIKKYDTKFTLGKDITKFISDIMLQYIENNTIELSDITNFPGTPWTQTVNSNGLYSEIKSNVIKEYYLYLLNEQRLY